MQYLYFSISNLTGDEIYHVYRAFHPYQSVL